MFFLYLFMVILCNTLLPSDRAHTIPADIGKTIKRKQVFDKVIEADVAPIITIVSIHCKNVFGIL